MKKLLAFVCVVLSFVACSENKNTAKNVSENVSDKDSQVVLKVGATPVPQAEILEFIKPDLAAEGIDLQIVSFTDYVTPNTSVYDGSIDANYFQHKPFLDSTNKDKGYNLQSIAVVHIEPLRVYSKKIKELDSLVQGATIAIPSDVSNGARALILLHDKGVLKLKDPSNLSSSELDIAENPKQIKIKPIEAALLPRVLGDVDAAIINGNYALQAGLKSSDAISLEGEQSPYVNILVVQSARAQDKNLLKLKAALQSQKVKDFIKEKYQGEIIPAF